MTLILFLEQGKESLRFPLAIFFNHSELPEIISDFLGAVSYKYLGSSSGSFPMIVNSFFFDIAITISLFSFSCFCSSTIWLKNDFVNTNGTSEFYTGQYHVLKDSEPH